MRKSISSITYFFICFCLLIFVGSLNSVWAKEFVVVIDPGHGGKDPGALGKRYKEKEINLKVALKLGNKIKNECRDVKVVYTRDKDVFVSLEKRAEIANREKADLFISIHTNSVKSSSTLKGASTWTLGATSSKENLEVAQRENAVITMEDDYKARYENFDPSSSESYIMFDLVQNRYMEESIHLARLVQKHFKNSCKRVDKGVHQAGFLVLKHTVMPSVLVELGFISTPEEEIYLFSDTGAANMANGVFKAFLEYKNTYRSGTSATDIDGSSFSPGREVVKEETSKPESSLAKNEILFKVQILTAPRLYDKNDKRFKGLKGVEHYLDGRVYKYTYGSTTNYNEILRIRRSIVGKFKDAFVIAFKNNQRMDINAAIREYKKRNK